MRTITKTLLLSLCACWAGALPAQENDFDLSSQRREVQHTSAIPGRKLDHHGLIVSPVPHAMTVDSTRRLDVAGGFRLKDRQKAFADVTVFVVQNKKGPELSIDFGAKKARKHGVRVTSGAYALTVNEDGVDIVGYDERGAFYGLQTLRQLMTSPVADGGRLPYVSINDYPDLPNRGVVEGFYGTPWSHQVRLSLIDFYGRFKLNTYLYGPKDDPYHSSPNWREPYPDKEARQLGELVEACRRNRVDFVWAIHPGKDIRWNDEDYAHLVDKLNHMYDLGVRHFAIFFDDISGPGTDPRKQTELLNRLTRDFVEAKGDVGPLTVCPTDYSKLWANPSPQGSLAIYGQTLAPGIKVMWTGDYVCSDLTKATMDWLNARIKRPGYYWWNFPVTDYARHIVMQGPTYGLDPQLTADDLCGIVSNPMEYGEASKLALYGVADYAWNVAAYNALDNWERGLAELVPGAAAAYRTFAIHSGDTETGYRRDESWETQTFRLNEWTDPAADALEAEFRRIEAVPGEMERGCANRALLSELRPWLEEFGRLGTRGRQALELGRIYRKGEDPAAFWNLYVRNLMSPEDRKRYDAHRCGTLKLQPFYERMMDDMAHAYLERLSGEVPCDYVGMGSFRSAATTQTKLMFDADTKTFYTSGISQKAGDWIGVDLRAVRDVSEVNILQGRNSVDDVDYFDHARLECSTDGTTWQPLLPELKEQYVVRWKGEPVRARYVRLLRLDSKRTNYASVRTFEVNPLRTSALGFPIEAADTCDALRAFDQNLGTSCRVDGRLAFGVPAGTKGCTLLLGARTDGVRVVQNLADGTLAGETRPTSSYVDLKLADGVASVAVEGPAEVYEIVLHKE